jgi:hypothetical protein
MKKELLIYFFGAALFSCSPENKHKTQELAADTTNISSQIDSARYQAGLDGTLVQYTEKDDRRRLPNELKILLDSLYPGWKLPEVTPKALELALSKPQGPYFIAGYFNADTYKDHVVQIADRRMIKVIGFVNSADSTQARELLQTLAIPGQGKDPTSPLSILPGEPKIKPGPGKITTISQPDTFILVNDNDSTTCYFDNKIGQLMCPVTKAIN